MRSYQWLFEILWFLLALVLGYTLTFYFQPHISKMFYAYLLTGVFITVNYFRWIVFPEKSALMMNFWFKVVLILINVPLFIWGLNRFIQLTEVFDSFNGTFENIAEVHIKEGIPLQTFLYLKTLTTFIVTSSLMLIVLFLFRSMHIIFKYRQVPQKILE